MEAILGVLGTRRRETLMQLCEELDKQGTGTVAFSPFSEALRSVAPDLSEADTECVCTLLDTAGTRAVDVRALEAFGDAYALQGVASDARASLERVRDLFAQEHRRDSADAVKRQCAMLLRRCKRDDVEDVGELPMPDIVAHMDSLGASLKRREERELEGAFSAGSGTVSYLRLVAALRAPSSPDADACSSRVLAVAAAAARAGAVPAALFGAARGRDMLRVGDAADALSRHALLSTAEAQAWVQHAARGAGRSASPSRTRGSRSRSRDAAEVEAGALVRTAVGTLPASTAAAADELSLACRRSLRRAREPHSAVSDAVATARRRMGLRSRGPLSRAAAAAVVTELAGEAPPAPLRVLLDAVDPDCADAVGEAALAEALVEGRRGVRELKDPPLLEWATELPHAGGRGSVDDGGPSSAEEDSRASRPTRPRPRPTSRGAEASRSTPAAATAGIKAWSALGSGASESLSSPPLLGALQSAGAEVTPQGEVPVALVRWRQLRGQLKEWAAGDEAAEKAVEACRVLAPTRASSAEVDARLVALRVGIACMAKEERGGLRALQRAAFKAAAKQGWAAAEARDEFARRFASADLRSSGYVAEMRVAMTLRQLQVEAPPRAVATFGKALAEGRKGVRIGLLVAALLPLELPRAPEVAAPAVASRDVDTLCTALEAAQERVGSSRQGRLPVSECHKAISASLSPLGGGADGLWLLMPYADRDGEQVDVEGFLGALRGGGVELGSDTGPEKEAKQSPRERRSDTLERVAETDTETEEPSRRRSGDVGTPVGGVGDGILRPSVLKELRARAREYERESGDPREAMRRLFEEADRDGSGDVSAVEFRDTLRRIGLRLRRKEEDCIVDLMDVHGDGEVSYTDFVHFLQSEPMDADAVEALAEIRAAIQEARESGGRKFRLREVFDRLDTRGRGVVRPREFREELERETGARLPSAAWRRVVPSLDRDADGRIRYDEFVRMVEPKDEEREGALAVVRHAVRVADKYGVSPRRLFEKRDARARGWVSTREFRDVLLAVGAALSPMDVLLAEEHYRLPGSRMGAVDYESLMADAERGPEKRVRRSSRRARRGPEPEVIVAEPPRSHRPRARAKGGADTEEETEEEVSATRAADKRRSRSRGRERERSRPVEEPSVTTDTAEEEVPPSRGRHEPRRPRSQRQREERDVDEAPPRRRRGEHSRASGEEEDGEEEDGRRSRGRRSGSRPRRGRNASPRRSRSRERERGSRERRGRSERRSHSRSRPRTRRGEESAPSEPAPSDEGDEPEEPVLPSDLDEAVDREDSKELKRIERELRSVERRLTDAQRRRKKAEQQHKELRRTQSKRLREAERAVERASRAQAEGGADSAAEDNSSGSATPSDEDTGSEADRSGGAGDGATAPERQYKRTAKAQIRRAFDLADKDRNQRLEVSEVARVLRSLGVDMTPEDAVMLARKYDRNRDGTLGRREFAEAALREMKAERDRLLLDESRLRELFARFDRDGSRAISRQEFAYALRDELRLDLSERELDALLAQLDTTGDGELEYAEFVALAKLVRRPEYDLPPDAARAVQKLARGPVPDPDSYMNAFAGLPSSFRPSLTSKLAKLRRHSLQSVLRPRVDPSSGLRFHDLLPASASLTSPREGKRAVAEAKSFPLRRQGGHEPRGQDVASGAAVPEYINLLLDFKLATAVPMPGDALRGDVVARFASMCLSYNASDSQCAPPPPALRSFPGQRLTRRSRCATAKACTWATCTASPPGGRPRRRTGGTLRSATP